MTDVSKGEQRVLHQLAMGGELKYTRAANGKITEVECWTRDGYVLSGVSLGIFDKLKRNKLIRSTGGNPYRITQKGASSTRSQLDQR